MLASRTNQELFALKVISTFERDVAIKQEDDDHNINSKEFFQDDTESCFFTLYRDNIGSIQDTRRKVVFCPAKVQMQFANFAQNGENTRYNTNAPSNIS
mmetsp:Transcript_1043/g.1375  ORF Transcript_1043/g.1375 Transcript_1043/m.1375 type:complete len:99 (-) Transcript_1043:3528-3824(-)